MPFKKLADETFEADFLSDAFDGVMDFISTSNTSDKNDGPETVIVIRNNVAGPNGQRTFTGLVYVGKTIDEIKNDLK